SASSCSAARTTSSTERLCPRWITSAPCDWISRRMMLMAASWPSNRLAAVTKRSGVRESAWGSGIWVAGVLMGGLLMQETESPDCTAPLFPPPARRLPFSRATPSLLPLAGEGARRADEGSFCACFQEHDQELPSPQPSPASGRGGRMRGSLPHNQPAWRADAPAPAEQLMIFETLDTFGHEQVVFCLNYDAVQKAIIAILYNPQGPALCDTC